MSDDTPTSLPVSHPDNTDLAEAVNRLRHATTDLSRGLGDIERTIRLALAPAPFELRGRLATFIDEYIERAAFESRVIRKGAP